jgi:quercetin dioxygenase-like cupin family protein
MPRTDISAEDHERCGRARAGGDARENCVGTEQGDVQMSAVLFEGEPGSGPKPHRHPDDEILFVREGRARDTWSNARSSRVGAGAILVVKAGEVHSFTSVGNTRLVQIDVHLNSTFITEWIPQA